MREVEFCDGDLVLVAWHSCGEALARLAAADRDATVFVPGPTIDRDGRLSIDEFASAADNVDVLLGSPRDTARETVERGDAQFVPSARAGDYPILMRRLSEAADRTVGVIETSESIDGVYTPGINGLAIDAILDLADVLIAEVNPREPALPGIEIETDRFDHRLPVDYNLPVLSTAEPDDVARTIGGAVADLIPDGSTLHVGYGSIPSAIAESLTDHENLGLHTGMVSPSVVDLLEEGVIARGSIVAEPLADCPFERPALATTTLGDSRSFYDWVESSRMVAIGSIGQMHDPCAAAANPKFTAVNSGVQVDLQGQVNAERMGARRFGGPGGQPDFFRIARSSEDGAGILALSSTHGGDVSTIVGRIAAGGVVTTPGHSLDYVVTEHAVADLRTATERERTSQLIETAAPRFRDDLRETAAEYGLR
jgi:acyl-CoA hydrolase